jgi:hypothetical protein
MAFAVPQDVAQLIRQEDSLKFISTLGPDKVPYIAASPHLYLNDDNRIVHLELLETSRTNRNLLQSIWFDQNVAVLVEHPSGRSCVITARGVKSIISGPVFQTHYTGIREKLGDVGLVAVWILEPSEIFEETFFIRQEREESRRLSYIHLDRLANNIQ